MVARYRSILRDAKPRFSWLRRQVCTSRTLKMLSLSVGGDSTRFQHSLRKKHLELALLLGSTKRLRKRTTLSLRTRYLWGICHSNFTGRWYVYYAKLKWQHKLQYPLNVPRMGVLVVIETNKVTTTNAPASAVRVSDGAGGFLATLLWPTTTNFPTIDCFYFHTDGRICSLQMTIATVHDLKNSGAFTMPRHTLTNSLVRGKPELILPCLSCL